MCFSLVSPLSFELGRRALPPPAYLSAREKVYSVNFLVIRLIGRIYEGAQSIFGPAIPLFPFILSTMAESLGISKFRAGQEGKAEL